MALKSIRGELASSSIPIGGGHYFCEVFVYISSYTNTIIDKIAMQFCINIHGSQSVKSTDPLFSFSTAIRLTIEIVHMINILPDKHLQH